MIIKTNFESLTSLLNTMNLVISCNKAMQETSKVVNFFVRNNKVQALATDNQLFCLKSIDDAEFDLQGEDDPFMVIQIKEISDILSHYNSLTRTEVKSVTLQTEQKGIIMQIVEGAKENKSGETFDFMPKENVVKNKLTAYHLMHLVTKELPTMVMPEGEITVNGKEFKKYLDYMYYPMSKPKDRVYMNFTNDLVWSDMGNVYGIAMPNKLPKEIFSEISIPLGYVNFFRTIIPLNKEFKIYKDVTVTQKSTGYEDFNIQKTFVLYMQLDDMLIKYKGIDKSNSLNTDVFKCDTKNSVEIDKPYFCDVLKRVVGQDMVFINVKIEEDPTVAGKYVGEMYLRNEYISQRIPIKSATGSGEFNFVVTPENLGLVAFSHLTKDIDGESEKVSDLLMYIEENKTSSYDITCMDRTGDWCARLMYAPKRAMQTSF